MAQCDLVNLDLRLLKVTKYSRRYEPGKFMARYEPTLLPLNEFLPRMPEGSIVASVELHYLKWPGGTQALLKGAKIGFIEINDSFVEQAEETARHLQNAGLRLRLKCGGDACSQYNQWGARGSA